MIMQKSVIYTWPYALYSEEKGIYIFYSSIILLLHDVPHWVFDTQIKLLEYKIWNVCVYVMGSLLNRMSSPSLFPLFYDVCNDISLRDMMLVI